MNESNHHGLRSQRPEWAEEKCPSTGSISNRQFQPEGDHQQSIVSREIDTAPKITQLERTGHEVLLGDTVYLEIT